MTCSIVQWEAGRQEGTTNRLKQSCLLVVPSCVLVSQCAVLHTSWCSVTNARPATQLHKFKIIKRTDPDTDQSDFWDRCINVSARPREPCRWTRLPWGSRDVKAFVFEIILVGICIPFNMFHPNQTGFHHILHFIQNYYRNDKPSCIYLFQCGYSGGICCFLALFLTEKWWCTVFTDWNEKT